jgi:hypothetical protein
MKDWRGILILKVGDVELVSRDFDNSMSDE